MSLNYKKEFGLGSKSKIKYIPLSKVKKVVGKNGIIDNIIKSIDSQRKADEKKDNQKNLELDEKLLEFKNQLSPIKLKYKALKTALIVETVDSAGKNSKVLCDNVRQKIKNIKSKIASIEKKSKKKNSETPKILLEKLNNISKSLKDYFNVQDDESAFINTSTPVANQYADVDNEIEELKTFIKNELKEIREKAKKEKKKSGIHKLQYKWSDVISFFKMFKGLPAKYELISTNYKTQLNARSYKTKIHKPLTEFLEFIEEV